eukprot:COSAG02_NODE_921_length_15917_cov_4.428057_14_plen_239_part_00
MEADGAAGVDALSWAELGHPSARLKPHAQRELHGPLAPSGVAVETGGAASGLPPSGTERLCVDEVPAFAVENAGEQNVEAAEAKRWQRTRSHPLYPQLVRTIAENSIEGLPPDVAAGRQPRVMAAPLPEQYNSADMTESVDFFVKDKIHNIAQNTEAQRKARTELENVGKQLLASLEQPVEHRLHTLSGGGAGCGTSAVSKRSQDEMKQLFMVASAKIQQERNQCGKKKRARAEERSV